MNDSWGFVPGDTNYKSGDELVQTIAELAGRGGNLLLNVSPTGTGALPVEQLERLEEVARWMTNHRDAIVGTRPGLEPWQWYGPSTKRAGFIYLCLLGQPYGDVVVRGINVRRVVEVRALSAGVRLEHRIRTGIVESLLPDPAGELRITVAPEVCVGPVTVLAVKVADQPVTAPTASLPS